MLRSSLAKEESVAKVAPAQADSLSATLEDLKLNPQLQSNHNKESTENDDSEDDEYETVNIISNIDDLLSDDNTESEDDPDNSMEEEEEEEEEEEFRVENAFSNAFTMSRNSTASSFSDASSFKPRLAGIIEETDDELNLKKKIYIQQKEVVRSRKDLELYFRVLNKLDPGAKPGSKKISLIVGLD